MCICKRKSVYRENAVVTKKGSRVNQYNNGNNNDAPMMRGSHGASGAQVGIGEAPNRSRKDNRDHDNNNDNNNNNNVNAQSPAEYRGTKKREKSQQKVPGEDDTLTNIPDEMPEMELNRDKPEPFYTDDQLL